MGVYVNLQNGQTKEQWLAEHGVELERAPEWAKHFNPKDNLPVCLVDNGHFTAAAIAFSENELAAFDDPRDFRPKRWYMVTMGDLVAVTGVNLPDLLKEDNE